MSALLYHINSLLYSSSRAVSQRTMENEKRHYIQRAEKSCIAYAYRRWIRQVLHFPECRKSCSCFVGEKEACATFSLHNNNPVTNSLGVIIIAALLQPLHARAEPRN